MRAGQKLITQTGGKGVITSGGYSPSLEKSIAFARVPLDTDTTCLVDIRGKQVSAKVVKPRFVKDGNALI